ncbi:hypothetical protein [Thermoactinomyces sp. DSM 45892]|uniref:hypothetical protein n=1 Tax=Thermoactinomyces sp. DSM 45892 TaxID=1882753 RepID=UPI00089B3E15|nr:hypothetical protein [Thermoactinomyces sp. DSM 45892]SDY29916.1 hypothetical protein SAMN05444416_103213 [Thermoactinomyces sp. DSM 45892]
MKQPRNQKEQTKYEAEFSNELLGMQESEGENFVQAAINRAYSQSGDIDETGQERAE